MTYQRGDLIEYIRPAPGYDEDGIKSGELGVIIRNEHQVEAMLTTNVNHAVLVVFFKNPRRPRHMYPEEIKKADNA